MRMRHSLAVCVALVAMCSTASASEAEALNSIKTEDLKRHVDVLADDSFEGREAGARGGRAAGVYASRHLSQTGLKPGGIDGGWFQPFDGRFRNILAIMPGSDPELKDEYIIVGAHYDHVGYGNSTNSYGPTGYIHNGADDNASGTAALLEVAEAFRELGTTPRRSVLFALWDAEEKGLLGSRHWLSSPTVPLDKVRLAINMDMVGRLRGKRLEVFGTRSSRGLRRLVSQAGRGTDLLFDFTWEMKNNSDHWSFYDRNIPIIMFHTGLHDDYHRPRDDAEKINNDGIRKVSKALYQLIVEAADADRLEGFRRAAQGESPYGRQTLEAPLPPLPTRLGVRWDEKDADAEADGLRIVHVEPGKPAALAGLRTGDRLIEFAGRPIARGDDLRAAVWAATSPASVKVLRAGQEKPDEIKVPLAGKPVRVGLAWREDRAEPGSVVVTRVVPGTPAGLAGLKVRDRIYQVAGEDFRNSDEFLERVTTSPGPLDLLVERRGQLQTVELVFAKPAEVSDAKKDAPGENDATPTSEGDSKS